MEKRLANRARNDASNPAVGLFGILTVAAEDGNFATAAAAQRRLADLGWNVTRHTDADLKPITGERLKRATQRRDA
jgi:hypothetical protein